MSGNEHPTTRDDNPSATDDLSRRGFMRDAFCGFGGVALSSLLQYEAARAADSGPLRARLPPLQPKARNVIFLFMAGVPSQL